MIGINVKTCRLCEEEKPLNMFENDRRQTSGITTRCKQCKSEANSKPRKAFRRLYERQKVYPIPIETSAKVFEQLFGVYDDRCVYCFESFNTTPTIDHITPLSLGGRHKASNLTICCKSCNSRKGNRPLLVFYDKYDKFHSINLAAVIKVKARLSRQTVAEVEQLLNKQRDDYYKKREVIADE